MDTNHCTELQYFLLKAMMQDAFEHYGKCKHHSRYTFFFILHKTSKCHLYTVKTQLYACQKKVTKLFLLGHQMLVSFSDRYIPRLCIFSWGKIVKQDRARKAELSTGADQCVPPAELSSFSVKDFIDRVWRGTLGKTYCWS